MIGFAGLSHLGAVSSIVAASKGCQVIGYDPDEVLSTGLQEGRLEIVEAGLAELLADVRPNIRFTSSPADLAECSLIYFCQDVPTDYCGRSDLGLLNSLIKQVLVHASSETTLVVLSQVPPGFTRQFANNLHKDQIGKNIRLYCQVETLVFGQAVERAMHPERIIVGCADSTDPLPDDYASLLNAFDCQVLPMRYESAELAKISINMFLASSVSTTNTLAEICEVIGADWSEIIPALRSDRRIGQYAYLSPGLGLSGGHLERDLATITTLAAQHGTDAGIVDAWLDNSRSRLDWALRTVHSQIVSRCERPTVAIWGLAYKPGTASTTNSPGFALVNALTPLSLRVYDPEVVLDTGHPSGVFQAATALEACRDADGLVIATPWREFSDINLTKVGELMSGRVIIDPFGAVSQNQCAALGFSYSRLGSTPNYQVNAQC
jgi:UDPglucose 6-dehydrogenase